MVCFSIVKSNIIFRYACMLPDSSYGKVCDRMGKKCYALCESKFMKFMRSRVKRSIMQAYVKGSDEAVELYQKAFDARLISSYLNSDGTYYHSELDIQGEILAIAERNLANSIGDETITGNVMQFCLHYGQVNEDTVRKAYEVLKADTKIIMPLAACEFR